LHENIGIQIDAAVLDQLAQADDIGAVRENAGADFRKSPPDLLFWPASTADE
jgi:hypothetical protein